MIEAPLCFATLEARHERQDHDFRLWADGPGDRGRLQAAGRETAIAQRSKPPALPKAMSFVACDALDRGGVVKPRAARISSSSRSAFPMSASCWREAWPKAVANFVAASEAAGARMLFIYNLYAYGPQTAPLVETMPLTSYGVKPAPAPPRPASG